MRNYKHVLFVWFIMTIHAKTQSGIYITFYGAFTSRIFELLYLRFVFISFLFFSIKPLIANDDDRQIDFTLLGNYLMKNSHFIYFIIIISFGLARISQFSSTH